MLIAHEIVPVLQPVSGDTGGRRFEFGSPAFVAPYGGLSDDRATPVDVAALRAVLGV